MEIALLVLVVLFINKAVDFAKYLTNQDWNGALTQLVTWAVAVGTVFLASESGLYETFGVNGVNFGDLNAAGLWLTGLAIGSGGSFAKDWLKARDDSDSAKMPSLIPGK